MRMIDLPIKSVVVKPPSEVEKSGPYRQRRVSIGMPYTVNVTWELDESEAFYISRFFISLGNGASPFDLQLPSIVPLAIENFHEEYRAYFHPDSFSKRLVNYKKYTVSATLDVEAVEPSSDAMLFMDITSEINSASRDDHLAFLNMYEGLVNTSLGTLN